MGATAITIAASGAVLFACNNPASGQGGRKPGQPVETERPNAVDQRPAFSGQTRAPYQTAGVGFDTRVVASGLDHPWSLAFLPDGSFLNTERSGRLQIITRQGARQVVAGVPRVDPRGQGGLFASALDPGFADNRTVFLTYAEPRECGNGTALARAQLVREPTPRLHDLKVIWRMTRTLDYAK